MGSFRQALAALHHARIGLVFVFVVVATIHKLANAWIQRASLPSHEHIALRRLWMASEAHIGASNAVAGGAGVGFGLRAAMLRSWGVDSASVGASLLVCASAPSVAMWVVLGFHSLAFCVLGGGSVTNIATFALAAAVLGAQVGVGRFLLSDRGVGYAGRSLRRVGTVVQRRLPRLSRRLRCFDGDPARWTHEVRDATADVVRARRWSLLASSVVAQLTLATLLLIAGRLVVPSSVAIDGWAVLRGFAVVRAMSSCVPLPNGLGVLDVGLVSVLVGAGVPGPAAAIALAVYRFVTLIVPIFTGAMCTAWWRTRAHAARPVHPQPVRAELSHTDSTRTEQVIWARTPVRAAA